MMKDKRVYDRCEFCSGEVREVVRDESLWHNGKLTIVKGEPVGLCRKCGEKYYKGAILEAMELIASRRGLIRRTMQVPVAAFPL